MMINRKFFKVALLTFLFIKVGFDQTSLYAADEKDITFHPPIKAVTVYPDRALVTRKTEIALPVGRSTLTFKNGLPSLLPESLAGFSESDSVIVQNSSSRLEMNTATVDPKLRELENKRDVLGKKISSIQRDIDSFVQRKRQIVFYENYLQKFIGEASLQKSLDPIAKWNESLSFLTNESEQIKKNIQTSEIEKEKLESEFNLLQREIDKISTEQQKSVRWIQLTVVATKPVTAVIGFSYIVPNASWSVSYGMTLKDDHKIQIDYYGNVQQKTGEDWKDVTLRLSTGNPARDAARPLMTSLRFYAYQDHANTTLFKSQRLETASRQNEVREADVATEDNAATASYSKVEESSSPSLLFVIDRPANVESEKMSRRVTIASFTTAPAKLSYLTIPMQSKGAYLVAKSDNKQKFPLLAGPADIYRDSGFTGRTSFPFTPPASSFEVSFGVQAELPVYRTRIVHKGTAGLTSSNKLYTTTVRIKLENRTSTKKTVTLMERMPVSYTDKVKVSLLSTTTQGYHAEKQKESGILQWDVNLNGGETKEILLVYSVETPDFFPASIIENDEQR